MNQIPAGPTDLPTLDTPRLILRPFEGPDAEAVQRMAGAREVADTTATIPHPYGDGVAQAWIRGHRGAFAARQALTLAVVRRQGRDLVGAVGLRLEPGNHSAELGYWIGRAFWNRGYCTEAASAVVAYAFEALALHRIHACHMTRNPASGRVLVKLGMRHEGTQREALLRWGAFEDIALYGLLHEEQLLGRK